MNNPQTSVRPLHFAVLGLSFVALLVGLALAVTVCVVALRDPLSPELAPDAPVGGRLPLAETPALGHGDAFVLYLTGVGGWNRTDQGFARELARLGYPTVALDSFRYFSQARTAREAGADLDQIIQRYAVRWRRPQVILAGYSYGASPVLQLWSVLSPGSRARIAGVALVAPERRTDLRIHPYSFWQLDKPGQPSSVVWLEGWTGPPVACVYAPDDPGAACRAFPKTQSRPRKLTGGHLFIGRYADVAKAIAATQASDQPSR